MRRAGVAQHVRTDVPSWRKTRSETRLPDQLPDPLTGQAAASRAQEQKRRTSFSSQYFPAAFQVSLQRLLGRHSERDHALFVALAAHQDVSHFKLEVFETSVGNFGHAHSRGIEK